MAQVTFTCTGGKNYGQGGEGDIKNIFDGETNTKYCANAGDDVYALVTASEAVYLYGYELTTANDNATYGRCLKQWQVFGTNDAAVAADANAEGWVTLSDFGNNNMVASKNFYTQRFFCDKDKMGKAYKYFKVVLKDGGFIQVSEFNFCYDTNLPVTYDFVEASNGSFAKAVDGFLNTKFEGSNLAGNWVIIKTSDGQPHPVKKYSISTSDDGDWKDRAPKTWKVEASNDKTNWTTIHTVTNDPIENTNFKTFEFTPTDTETEYTYIRFTMNSMKSTGWTQIGEFHIYSSADVDAYYEGLVDEAKSLLDAAKTALGETDSWYVEYKNKCDALDDALTAAKISKDYDGVAALMPAVNAAKAMVAPFAEGKTVYAFAGSDCWGDGHYSQLVDKNENTKWGGNFSGNVGDANHVQWAVFRVKEAFAPFFYKLVTGGDTKSYNGRNWKTWSVYGGNFASPSEATRDASGWTLLDERVDISEKYLPMENKYPATFDFNKGVSQPYLYFMVKVTEAHSGGQIQMSEMYLCTKEEFESIRKPLVDSFDDFDQTRPIESDLTDELSDFQTLFEELKTTADAVRLTEVYNELVALRTQIEASMDYLEYSKTLAIVDGVFQLGTAQDLDNFSKIVAIRNDQKARLTADIDLKDVNMAPIGNEDSPFKGTFNGYGHAVKNFTYSDENENNVGLFGLTSGAVIAHLNLTGANIKGDANVGGLVGNAQNGTYIMDCAVVNSYVEGRDHVGAVVGEIRGNSTVQNCYSDADVYSRGYQAGGLAGTSRGGSLLNNLFLGSIACAGGSVGGVVALIDAEDDNVKTTIKGNVIAATSINLGWGDEYFFYLTNPNGKSPVIEDNYVLTTTKFRENKTLADVTGGNQGTAVADVKKITCQSFYETTLGWDLNADWCFYQAGKFPLPVIMRSQAAIPSQTITVSEAGFGTAVAEFEIDFSNSDVKAYIAQVKVDAKNVNYVHLEPITIVPEGEAFVVKAAAGTYFVPAAVEWGVAESNDLKATTAELVADGTQYILAQVEGEVAFHQATENSVIPAGKGYLELDGAGPLVKAFFGDEESETAITNVNVNGNGNNAAIYNMSGQRVSKLQKGVNIVNGRKVLY